MGLRLTAWCLGAGLATAALGAEPHNHELRVDTAPPAEGAMLELLTERGETVLAYATGDPAAAQSLLVLHEMWGLTPWVKAEADAWAREGYRVLALDLYSGVIASDSRTALGLMRDTDARWSRRALGAALTALGRDGRPVGVLGWCFGGEQALVAALAHPAQVGAVVMYYGRPETVARRLAPLQAPVLGLFASEDSWVPRRQVTAFERAMSRAGKRLELEWYAAGHAFANPSGAHHDAALAAAARARAAAFLARELAAPSADESGRL